MQNIDIVRTLHEQALSNRRIDLLPELLAPDYLPAFRAAIQPLLDAFPDLRYTLTDLVADGDRVAARWTLTGTHARAFRGNPPTHETITNTGIAIYTLRDGRITGAALETDRLGFLEQIAPPRAVDPARAPGAVYLIDEFHVPAPARADFEAAMSRNRAFIRTLDGFRGDAVFVTRQGESFDIATIAAWASPDAIARAKQTVAAHYTSLGFDLQASLARWGVTLRRTIADAPPALQ
ncbi:MAG TPA: ester cyclase [Kofleriaceae bacterium]|nr:ester cyclase [Kofleriaceae bacterium]